MENKYGTDFTSAIPQYHSSENQSNLFRV
jgi:hypothetical protein